MFHSQQYYVNLLNCFFLLPFTSPSFRLFFSVKHFILLSLSVTLCHSLCLSHTFSLSSLYYSLYCLSLGQSVTFSSSLSLSLYVSLLPSLFPLSSVLLMAITFHPHSPISSIFNHSHCRSLFSSFLVYILSPQFSSLISYYFKTLSFYLPPGDRFWPV